MRAGLRRSRAIVTLQAYYRGYLARRGFADFKARARARAATDHQRIEEERAKLSAAQSKVAAELSERVAAVAEFWPDGQAQDYKHLCGDLQHWATEAARLEQEASDTRLCWNTKRA